MRNESMVKIITGALVKTLLIEINSMESIRLIF